MEILRKNINKLLECIEKGAENRREFEQKCDTAQENKKFTDEYKQRQVAKYSDEYTKADNILYNTFKATTDEIKVTLEKLYKEQQKEFVFTEDLYYVIDYMLRASRGLNLEAFQILTNRYLSNLVVMDFIRKTEDCCELGVPLEIDDYLLKCDFSYKLNELDKISNDFNGMLSNSAIEPQTLIKRVKEFAEFLGLGIEAEA